VNVTKVAQSRTAIQEIIERLNSDGICEGLSLAPNIIAEIYRFATNNVCYGSFERSMAFLADEHEGAERRFGCRIMVGHFLESIETCVAAKLVAQNETILRIATDYLGNAKLIAFRLWWSFPSEGASPEEIQLTSQGHHFDLDDWRQLKFFFYIGDVDGQNGPHFYVRGSHRRRPLRFQLSPLKGRDFEEIARTYGTAKITTITGPAGTGFVEDPFGYHGGAPVVSGRRLILELSFGVSDLIPHRRYGAIRDQ